MASFCRAPTKGKMKGGAVAEVEDAAVEEQGRDAADDEEEEAEGRPR
jgi:hypothetical protein